MAKIIFDESTRQFSVINENREFTIKVGNEIVQGMGQATWDSMDRKSQLQYLQEGRKNGFVKPLDKFEDLGNGEAHVQTYDSHGKKTGWKKTTYEGSKGNTGRSQGLPSPKKPSKLHTKTGKAALLGGVAVGSGAAVGTAANRVAHKSALKRGLEPGTPEYNAYVRKRTAIGAAAGAMVGGGITAGVMHHKGLLNFKKSK